MIDLISLTALMNHVKNAKYTTTVVFTDTEKAIVAGYIEDALVEALDIFWPKLTLSEQRTPVAGLIAWEQANETKFDLVEGVYRTDPTLGKAVKIAHRIVPDGVQVAAAYGAVWIRFMEPKPQLSAEEYVSTDTYIEDSLVTDPADGNCYLARTASTGSTPNENPIDWKLQAIPLFLKKFVRLKARHQMLSEDDGKWTALRDADAELDRLCLAEFDQQGQGRVAGVRC